MSDYADDAERTEQLLRDAALSQRKAVGPIATGACHYCDADVAADARFCDAECRDAFETVRHMAARLGTTEG